MVPKATIAGWLAFGLSGLALAQTAPTTSGAKPPAEQKASKDAEQKASKDPEQESSFSANRVTGKITAVDQAKHQVTISDAGKQQNLNFSDSATVFLDGRLGSIDDLKEGQEVRAAYEERGGEKNLRWLDITAAQAAPTKNMPAPEHGPMTP